ncbi:hypothetical protein AB0D60_34870 [Streptomyces sp. NPDC048306]|uniref:hypothetical protein n=1 Tax=Streptomyces sp. NPDC048306 TaxID=3154502 RepID=UPI0033D53A2D
MTAPALYEIETSEGGDGTMHPAEQVWTPCADGAADHGFIAHQSLFVAGIDGGADDDLHPVGFLVLGHQRWADVIEAAAAYMSRTHGWRNLHLYPGDDPAVLIPRIPRAVHTHGVFLRHPHPDHSCGGPEREEHRAPTGTVQGWNTASSPVRPPSPVPSRSPLCGTLPRR